MDKISLIIPVYNGEKKLVRCLNSLINQTYPNLELILVNDGSTDESFSICQAAKQQDSRIKVLNQNNQGRNVARNHGIEAATGDFISFMDQDDVLELDYFEKLHRQVEQYHSDIACCAYKIIKDGKVLPQTFPNQEKAVGVYSNKEWLESYGTLFYQIWLTLTSPWAKIIRRSCMTNVFFPNDRKYAEDTKTVWKCYLNATTLSYQQDACYVYDQPTNTNEKTAFEQFELVKALEEQMAFLSSIGLDIRSTYKVYISTLEMAHDLAKIIGAATEYRDLEFKLSHLGKGVS